MVNEETLNSTYNNVSSSQVPTLLRASVCASSPIHCIPHFYKRESKVMCRTMPCLSLCLSLAIYSNLVRFLKPTTCSKWFGAALWGHGCLCPQGRRALDVTWQWSCQIPHKENFLCVCVCFISFFFFSFLAPKQRWHRSIREWCNLDMMLWSAFGLIFLVWSKARCPQAAVLLMAFLGMKEQKKKTPVGAGHRVAG